MSATKTKTALFLNPKEVRQLKQIAKRLDVSMSHLVREGVKMVIKKFANK
jgi:Ribbon-helix-helix domain